jgi:hypothetical protein
MTLETHERVSRDTLSNNIGKIFMESFQVQKLKQININCSIIRYKHS